MWWCIAGLSGTNLIRAPSHLPHLTQLSSLGPPLLAAEFRGALAAALGTEALLQSFLAVRRSEWEHFGEAALEAEAALLYARY